MSVWTAPCDLTEEQARQMVRNITCYSGYAFARLVGRDVYYTYYFSIGD